ncbi:hypothetical protein LTR08_007341 [Meristemomyces frigidus]|nr:hypothetical protein LTR08_007341 [Meristemomyces frigidus]
MTTHAPMARVPFAPLDNPRLQHLASAKNRQNGMPSVFGITFMRVLTRPGTIAQKSNPSGKANVTTFKSVLSPAKRPFELSTYDDVDSENVDPTTFSSPSKKSKGDVLMKPFTFSLAPATSMLPPPLPSRLTTPVRANMSSPRAPMTAPAGRSPKRKSFGLNKSRRVSAPFTRIDPPFGSSRAGSTLPFSLDAALSGTFSTPMPKENDVAATIQESMPKNWFFEIYEDTPEEESANLMEHSTLTLDLGSDDESSMKDRDDRGKENCPPENYDAPTASRAVVASAAVVYAPRQTRKTDVVRKKIVKEEMDDGERAPLSDLETEPFIPEGLDKDSYIIVDPTPQDSVDLPANLEANDLYATPVPFTASSPKETSKKRSSTTMLDMPVVNAQGDYKGEVLVWEDSPVSEHTASPSLDIAESQATTEVELSDENAAPVVDEVA